MTRITDMTTRTAPTVNALVPFAIPGDPNPYNFDAGQVANYQGAESGSVVRTIHDKLADIKHAKDFGLVGDGSDEGARLTAFINSANSNPGILHLIHQGIFCTSVTLPTISVDNVWIEGSPGDFHSVGAALSGTIIKRIGSASANPMLAVVTPAGAGSQYLTGIRLKGLSFDCNSLSAIGFQAQTARQCEFDLAGANATSRLFDLGVISGALGENQSLQTSKIRLRGRQVESASGICLYLSGTAAANPSFNEIWCDFYHKNAPAIVCANSDNNKWDIRTFRDPAGTATEAVQLLGGATSGTSSRAEIFNNVSGNLPIRVYGTSDGYAAASVDHVIHHIDTANGTPSPVVGVGGKITFPNLPFICPEWYGAKGDGTGDDGPALNAFFAAAGGKEMRLNPKVLYAASTALTICNGTSTTNSTINGINIVGPGAGSAANEEAPAILPCCIKWTGSAAATVLTINGPATAVSLKGFSIDCNNLAATGIKSNHLMESKWDDVLVTRNAGGFGIILEAYAGVGGVFAQGANKNTFTNLRVKNVGAGGSGIRIGVTSGYVNQMLDVAQNIFINPCFENDGADASTCAMQLSFCDVLSFIGGQWRPTTGSLGDGVRITPPAGTGNHLKFPAAISFDNPAIKNGFTVDATWVPSQGIKCAAYHSGDGEPIPTSPYIWGTDTNGLSFGGGIGYVAGMGGTITQATSKATGVTLNKLCGSITLNNAALAAGAIVSFTLTDSFILADDELLLRVKSGFATAGTYRTWAEGNAAGSRTICVQNVSAGSLSEAVVVGLILFRGQSS